MKYNVLDNIIKNIIFFVMVSAIGFNNNIYGISSSDANKTNQLWRISIENFTKRCGNGIVNKTMRTIDFFVNKAVVKFDWAYNMEDANLRKIVTGCLLGVGVLSLGIVCFISRKVFFKKKKLIVINDNQKQEESAISKQPIKQGVQEQKEGDNNKLPEVGASFEQIINQSDKEQKEGENGNIPWGSEFGQFPKGQKQEEPAISKKNQVPNEGNNLEKKQPDEQVIKNNLNDPRDEQQQEQQIKQFNQKIPPIELQNIEKDGNLLNQDPAQHKAENLEQNNGPQQQQQPVLEKKQDENLLNQGDENHEQNNGPAKPQKQKQQQQIGDFIKDLVNKITLSNFRIQASSFLEKVRVKQQRVLEKKQDEINQDNGNHGLEVKNQVENIVNNLQQEQQNNDENELNSEQEKRKGKIDNNERTQEFDRQEEINEKVLNNSQILEVKLASKEDKENIENEIRELTKSCFPLAFSSQQNNNSLIESQKITRVSKSKKQENSNNNNDNTANKKNSNNNNDNTANKKNSTNNNDNAVIFVKKKK